MPMHDRLPPFSEGDEQALLGCILLDPVRVMDLCQREKITPSHFYVPQTKCVYEHCLGFCAGKGAKYLNMLNLATFMEGEIQRIGGSVYLERLIDITLTASHAPYHVGIVKQKWMARAVIECGRQAEALAYESDNGWDVLAKAQALFLDIDYTSTLTDANEIWKHVEKQWDDAESGIMPGIPSPWKKMDNTTGGPPIGLSTALAAPRASRKSYLLAQWAMYLGEQKIPGGYFPFEDGNVITMARMISMHAGLSAYHLRIGRAGEEKIAKAKHASKHVVGLPIGWHGRRGLDTDQLEAIVASGVARHKWKWVFGDAFKDLKRNYNRNGNEEDARQSKHLADIAERYQVAVVFTHHVVKLASRSQKEDDKPLIMDDLRGFGGILDDARQVIFVQRSGDRYALDIQKNSHGKEGYIELRLVDENIGLFAEADAEKKEQPEPVKESQDSMPF